MESPLRKVIMFALILQWDENDLVKAVSPMGWSLQGCQKVVRY